MCAASAGSHFTSSGKGSSNQAGTSPSYAPSAYSTGSHDLSSYAPNGSASSPMRPVYPTGKGGETEEFLAIMGAAQPQTEAQPQLTPAESPVSGPANPLVAAKMANTSGTDSGLFPIQDGSAQAVGREFDTAFSEGGSKKTGLVVAVIVIIVIAIFAAAFYFVSSQEAGQAKQNLDDAVTSLTLTDTVISGIDEAVATQMSGGDASEGLTRALEQSTTAQNNLSSAETSANEALRSSSKMSEAEQDAANAVLTSVSARRSMLEAARQIQSAGSATSGALDVLNQAYDLIAQADSKLSYADELWGAYNGGGDISWLNSQDILDNEMSAYNDLQNALSIVNDAVATYASVDFNVIQTYLSAYIDQTSARYTHNSYIINNNDTDSANSQMDWYNNATSNRDAAKANLPATASEYVSQYGPSDASVDAYLSNYAYAREKLVAADATVSAYASTVPAVSGELPSAQQEQASSEEQPAEEQTSEEQPAESTEEAAPADEASSEEAATEEQPAEEQSSEEQAA